MSKNAIHLFQVSSDFESDNYEAGCSCGWWSGGLHATMEQAAAEWMQHKEESTEQE